MKKVGHIRRPFQSQAIAVVMLCRFLAEKFNALGQTAIIESSYSLEATFNNTLDVLGDAATAVADLRTFDTSNFKEHETVKAFGTALNLIEGSFKSLPLHTEWDEKKGELAAAVTKDVDRQTKLKDKLSGCDNKTSAKVKVNVIIHEKSLDGKQLDTTTADEEGTMRLSALRWNVAGVLESEDKKHAARTAGTFFKESEEIAAHSTLAEIAGSGNEVTLKLVIP